MNNQSEIILSNKDELNDTIVNQLETSIEFLEINDKISEDKEFTIDDKSLKKTNIKSNPQYKLQNVLEPCNIDELEIDISKLKEHLKKDYLTPGRMEYYESTKTKNLNLEDGFMEFITAKSINGTRVGEGNCPIDVVKNNKGIDILCVCLNKNKTNEKSIMQNFSSCGNKLDNLFEKGKYQEALCMFVKEYHKKMLNAIKTQGIEKLYYCAFISTNKNIYMSVFKINLDCILNIVYESITTTKKSIKFKGFIDNKYGITTLFKSKKRLEIRLNRSILDCFNTIKLL